jgi:hypothetical protein
MVSAKFIATYERAAPVHDINFADRSVIAQAVAQWARRLSAAASMVLISKFLYCDIAADVGS